MLGIIINYSNYINIFLNILTVCIIIYFIYQIIIEYQQEKEFTNNNITTYSDLDIINEQYKDSQLCQLFKTLSEKDQEYLYHIMNAQRIKYKEEKPKATKKVNNIKSQLFYNMIITLLIKQKMGAVFDSLKHNTLFTFMSSL